MALKGCTVQSLPVGLMIIKLALEGCCLASVLFLVDKCPHPSTAIGHFVGGLSRGQVPSEQHRESSCC